MGGGGGVSLNFYLILYNNIQEVHIQIIWNTKKGFRRKSFDLCKSVEPVLSIGIWKDKRIRPRDLLITNPALNTTFYYKIILPSERETK